MVTGYGSSGRSGLAWSGEGAKFREIEQQGKPVGPELEQVVQTQPKQVPAEDDSA